MFLYSPSNSGLTLEIPLTQAPWALGNSFAATFPEETKYNIRDFLRAPQNTDTKQNCCIIFTDNYPYEKRENYTNFKTLLLLVVFGDDWINWNVMMSLRPDFKA